MFAIQNAGRERPVAHSLDANLNTVENWFAGCLGGSPGQEYDPNCGSVGTEEQLAALHALRVWPNPAKEMLSFQFVANGPATIRLLDVFGREVIPSKYLAESAGEVEGFFQVKNLSPGVYVMEARSKQGGGSRQKVLLNR